MTDATNVETGGMGRRISEVCDLIDSMTIVDPAAAMDFVGKLARENDWTTEHAARVYAEYRRFLLMAWMSPRMVVPSDHVDQAWHLHLTHTRHYWDVLCGEILMKPLHHDPSLGTGDDTERHEDHYASTLSLYRYLFDEDAPSDIWPRPCTACRGASRGAVLASGTSATMTAIGLSSGLVALLFGHPLIGAAGLALGVFMLIVTIADANRSAAEGRYAKTYAAPRVRSYHPNSARGGSSTRSTNSDTSGSDAALAFTSWVDPTPAPTSHHSTSHGHSDHGCSGSSSHSSHSCGGSSGGHSCGSSCGGGGGCGGGGD